MQTEFGLGPNPAADFLGHQRDGLAAPIGQDDALGVDADGVGQEPGGFPRVGVSTHSIEMAGQHRRHIRSERIWALRQVEDGLGVDTQRPGNARAVSAVGTGKRDIGQLDQAQFGHRVALFD